MFAPRVDPSHTWTEHDQQKASRVVKQYSDRTVVVFHKGTGRDTPLLKKRKYICPKDITFGQLLAIIRRDTQLTSQQALYFFCNHKLMRMSETLGECQAREADFDGIVHIVYACENTFG